MKKIIVLIFTIALIFLYSSCKNEEIIEEPKPTVQSNEKSIRAFEPQKQKSLPLPKNMDITDSMEFIDSIIADYDVIQFQEFDKDFGLEGLQVQKGDGGYLLDAQKKLGAVRFNKPLSDYFDVQDKSYGVLLRFKTDETDKLSFVYTSRFGHVTLNFLDGKYPATDVSGDLGDKMLNDDWNNYVYTSGQWAYAFLTITKFGQKVCYIWAEDDASDYNFFTSFGEDWGSNEPFMFSIQASGKGEIATVSDIWLYSYKELKR